MKDNSYLKNLIENMDENTSLKQLQNYVDEMVNIRGFADETPQDCLLLLTEELGELAKEVRKSHTHIKNDTAKNTATLITRLFMPVNPNAKSTTSAEITSLNTVSVNIPVGGRNM